MVCCFTVNCVVLIRLWLVVGGCFCLLCLLLVDAVGWACVCSICVALCGVVKYDWCLVLCVCCGLRCRLLGGFGGCRCVLVEW